MPNKKTKGAMTAYRFFMEEVLENMKRDGEDVRGGLQKAANLAAPLWQEMSALDREPYEALAAEWKARNRGVDSRLDCTGQSVVEVQRGERDLANDQAHMNADIKHLIETLGNSDMVARHKFYVISFNIMCILDSGHYLPAEVGLVEFSVFRGVTNQYHEFIAPGQIPTGYSYSCMANSDSTHKIPVTGFELANRNYAEIYDRICQMACGGSDRWPPLFCLPNENEQVKYLMLYLRHKARDSRAVPNKIYDLSFLLYCLHSYVSDQHFSEGLARDLLSSSVFHYRPNVSCSWHWEQDNPVFCALNVAKRSCFLITDYLCPLYGITPIPNRHIPEKDVESASFVMSRPVEMKKPSINMDYTSPTLVARKSVFDEKEEKYKVPSAEPTLRKMSGSKHNDPLRMPSTQSFVAVASGQSRDGSSFNLNNSNFPCLVAESRPRGRASSVYSLGSESGRSSVFSVGGESGRSSVFSVGGESGRASVFSGGGESGRASVMSVDSESGRASVISVDSESGRSSVVSVVSVTSTDSNVPVYSSDVSALSLKSASQQEPAPLRLPRSLPIAARPTIGITPIGRGRRPLPQ